MSVRGWQRKKQKIDIWHTQARIKFTSFHKCVKYPGFASGWGDVEVFDWSTHKVHAPFIYAFSINRFLIFNELRSSKPFHKRTFWALHNYTLLNIRTIVQNYTPTPALIRVVTKISSCRVNTTSRWGIKQLGISLGAIFLLFSSESYPLLMTVLTNTL